MRKIIFLIALVLPICAYATDMCARDDTMVLVLDKRASPGGQGSVPAEWAWWVSFSYGRIAGDATCLSVKEGLGQTTRGAYYGTGEYANTLIMAEPGLYGVDADGNERKYCWCRMRHPFMSGWFCAGALSNSNGCKSVCASDCGRHTTNLVEMRSGAFDSVGL